MNILSEGLGQEEGPAEHAEKPILDTPEKVSASFGLRANFYPPKYWYDIQPEDTRTHLVFSPTCNFRCRFCYYLEAWKNRRVVEGNFDDFVEVRPYTPYEFRVAVQELIPESRFFKFSGGEPTLIPHLPDYLSVIKDEGGLVYLDTNASRVDMVLELVRAELVYGVGVSLQGVTREEAVWAAGIKNANVAWDKPLQTIKEALRANDTLIIPVTLTVFNQVTAEQIAAFADLLESIDPTNRTRLKINNFTPTRLGDHSLQPVDRQLLHDLVSRLVEERPQWKGRTTVVLTAVSEGRDSLIQPSFRF